MLPSAFHRSTIAEHQEKATAMYGTWYNFHKDNWNFDKCSLLVAYHHHHNRTTTTTTTVPAYTAAAAAVATSPPTTTTTATTRHSRHESEKKRLWNKLSFLLLLLFFSLPFLTRWTTNSAWTVWIWLARLWRLIITSTTRRLTGGKHLKKINKKDSNLRHCSWSVT